MKKSILFLAIIAGIGSGYFYKKSKASYIVEKTQRPKENTEKPSPKSQDLKPDSTYTGESGSPIQSVKEQLKDNLDDSIESSLADGKKVEMLLSNAKDQSKLFKDTNKAFRKTVRCINDGRCLKNKDKRFYDKSQDPTVYKLSNMLSIMSEISIEDSRLLEQVAVEDLLSALGTGNSGVDTLGSYLLLRIGENTYSDLFEKARDFKADSAQGFLRLVFDDEKYHGAPKQREELVEHYIVNSDQNTFASVVKELNTLSLSKAEATLFISSTCSRVGQGASESQKLIRHDIGKIARKFQIQDSCKI